MNRIDQSVAQMLAPFQKQAAAARPRIAPPDMPQAAPPAMASSRAAAVATTGYTDERTALAATSLEKANQVNGR